jgi:Cu/Ag efflux pump CusA
MTFKSKMMAVLTMLVFFAMASSSFAQVSLSLIPDPSAGEIQTNNNAQTASPGVSGAGILVS